MALDFYRLDNNDFLFALNENHYSYLQEIFEKFSQWTGLSIDQYSNSKLITENLQTLIRVIDKYIETADLNTNKKQASAILEFKGVINYFLSNNWDLRMIGD